MRKAVTVVAACALVTGIAGAQMKPKPAPTPTPGRAPLAVTGGASQAELAIQKVRRVSETEANRLYKNGAAVIVDVRSNTQFAVNHIRGAVNIPNSQLVARLKELPAGKTIITYCACSAEQSSGRAVLELNNHGVKNAAALKGGLAAWEAAGLPTASGPK